MVKPAYSVTTFEGHTFNYRTIAYIKQVRQIYTFLGGTGTVEISQGSYNTSVGASGNTHAGGGAADTVPSIDTPKNWAILQKAHRLCGGASWDRPELWIGGREVWPHHNHTIVIKDLKMSDEARKQVQDYFADLNGLASHAADNSWKPNPIPVFMYPLKTVRLHVIQTQAKKTKGWAPHPAVAHVQRALNVKSGTHLLVDGIFGPQTKAAYGRFEKQVGGDGDGIPGRYSATLLGTARYNLLDKAA